jgi:hypothetical protein
LVCLQHIVRERAGGRTDLKRDSIYCFTSSRFPCNIATTASYNRLRVSWRS